ncbi:MAG: hypothetical protein JWQ63_4123 [Mucilaginibacter sp.]|nr:hypothetical protein [Mucilaginibacter sp.]
MKENILEDFKAKKKTYSAFKDRMIDLLKDLIEKENIIPHQITGRIKEAGSLSKKIDKKGDKYNILSDITDVIGLRVITYLESDVDPIASILTKEFEKDEENSIDKRILKNDQFGYRSLHVVVSLNDKRIKLPEYSAYKAIKCEIQIRSILQHAWAEIEHDLGYKGTDIPDAYKRSFNRVAALLELADIEFVKLKAELDDYEKDVPELIVFKPEEVDINKASLNSILITNSIIEDVRKIIVKKTGYKLAKGGMYDIVIEVIKFFNIKTIKSLEIALEENKIAYIKFIKQFIDDNELFGELPDLVVLLYFGHYLAVKKEDISFINKYFSSFNFITDEGVAEVYLKTYIVSKNLK